MSKLEKEVKENKEHTKESKENKPDSEKDRRIIDVLCTAHTMVKNRTSTYHETLLYVFEEIIKILNNTPSKEEIQRRIKEKNARNSEDIENNDIKEAEKPKRTYSRRKTQTESDNESDNE